MEVDPLTGLEVARTGLYVHFPYCLRRCPYCDFTIAIARSVPGARYADAVLSELQMRLAARPAWSARPLDTVYLGGGTPSLWDPRDVGRVLDGIAATLSLAPEAEISLEANPEVADTARLAGYRAAGVNRLSLGIQSFDPAVLTTLGRSHSPADAEAAFRAARDAGFENVSVDLILGVPGQSLAHAVEDARRTVALQPDHVSSYVLTVEREHLGAETVFSRRLRQGRLALPADSLVIEMVDAVGEVLAGAGLVRSRAMRSPGGTRGTTRSTGPGASRSLSAPARWASIETAPAESGPPTSGARRAGSRRSSRAVRRTRSGRSSIARRSTRSACCSGSGCGRDSTSPRSGRTRESLLAPRS